MFAPRCGTLINKIYEPKKDIRNLRNKLNEWIDKMNIMEIDVECYDKIFENIANHIDNDNFPTNILFYDETLEGWKLMKEINILKENYPRQYKEVLVEERREYREIINMMKEDDKNKW